MLLIINIVLTVQSRFLPPYTDPEADNHPTSKTTLNLVATPTIDVAATQVAMDATLTANFLDVAGTMTAGVPPTPIVTVTTSPDTSGCTVRAARGLGSGVQEPEFFSAPFSTIYVRSEPLLRNSAAGQAINAIALMNNTETLVTGGIVGEPNAATGEDSGTLWWRVENYSDAKTGNPVSGWVSSGTTAISGDCTQLPNWQLDDGHTAALSGDNPHFSLPVGTWLPTVYGSETRLPFFGRAGQIVALSCKNCKVKLSTLDGQAIQDFSDGGVEATLSESGDYMFIVQVTNNNPTFVTLVIKGLS